MSVVMAESVQEDLMESSADEIFSYDSREVWRNGGANTFVEPKFGVKWSRGLYHDSLYPGRRRRAVMKEPRKSSTFSSTALTLGSRNTPKPLGFVQQSIHGWSYHPHAMGMLTPFHYYYLEVIDHQQHVINITDFRAPPRTLRKGSLVGKLLEHRGEE